MAATTDTRAPGWYVGCDDYQAGPFLDAMVAEAKLEDIERPRVCWNDHAIEFVAPPGVRVRLVKQYTNTSGRVFRAYERPDTGRRVDILVRGPHEPNRWGRREPSRWLLSNPQAKAQAMLELAET
jgi:hypothetical protein